MFKGILIDKADDKQTAKLTDIDEAQLPDHDVTVDVEYSTLNYKDALALTASAPIVRNFPLVPGIDFSGTVSASDNPNYKPGDKVVLNGWDVGESHWGGLAGKARVKGDWLVPLPDAFDTRQAMAIGTAGYTAMLCVLALERQGVTPDKGEIVVSGASGGVGSVAVAVLSKLGYKVVALTGRVDEGDYLKALGASEVMDRAELEGKGKPLARERWAGAVDTVGSHILVNICAATKHGGVVTACGLAAGMDFPATVAPFILRGVTLVGINSVICPFEERVEAWQRLGQDLDVAKLDAMVSEIGLSEVLDTAPQFLDGKVRGRIIVDVNR